MNRTSGLWIIPYFVATILWVALYTKTDSIAHLYLAGKQNPIIFVLILGMFLHIIVGLIREWHRPRS